MIESIWRYTFPNPDSNRGPIPISVDLTVGGLAGGPGIEPGSREPKARVLPLNDPPSVDGDRDERTRTPVCLEQS